jgi:hypothetical protein
MIGIYSFVDLFMTKSYESRIHHIFTLTLCNHYYTISLDTKVAVVYPLLHTEISSIFYILKFWLQPDTNVYNINLLVFYLTFFKFRIFDFYNLIYKNHSFISSYILYSSIGLFAMNMYWFTIMNKMLYKLISKYINIDTDINCRYICSYIYFINIVVENLMYTINKKNIYDILGISILAISSHLYNSDIYKNLITHKTDTFPNKDNIILHVNDNLCIHLRYFLGIITNYYNFEQKYIFLSGTIHFISFYANIINILYLLTNDTHKGNYFKYYNISLLFPYMVDTYIFVLKNPIHINIPFLFINTLIILVWTIQPFYKLSHVAFHLCLIAQTYYICLSNQ